MQRFYMIVLALALVLPATTRAQETSPRGSAPPSGIVWQVAGSVPGHIFAGTWCGVYQLADGGTRWSEVPGLRDVPAQRLLHMAGDVLLAGTGGWSPGGVWRHAPGEAWRRVLEVLDTPLAASLSGTRVYAVGIGPSGPTGSPVSVLRSDDRGQAWTEAGRPGTGALSSSIVVAVDTTTGEDVVLLARQAPRLGGTSLMRSRDRGATWEPFPGYSGQIAELSESPMLFLDQDGTTFYLAHKWRDPERGQVTRLYRGAATGAELTEVVLPPELREGGIVDLVPSGNTLIAAGSRAVFTQTGAAGSWTRFDQGLGSSTIFDLHFTSGSTPRPLAITYAATSTGVYEYNPATATWRHTAPGLPTCNAPGRTVYERLPSFPVGPEHHFFPETGHSLSYAFKTFWERNGGLPVFGFPLSEEFDERNVDLQRAFTTQYFERERFEYHPENAGTPFSVLLGRLGDELLVAQGRDWRQEDGTGNPFPGGTGPCRDFDVGGERRSVCGPFLQYWQSHGLSLDGGAVSFEESLMLFGLPLTAPRLETNPDGDRVLTQWFERARFEYHPDNPEPYKVLLGRLGAEILRLRGVP